jgi:hypothetical protein
MMSRTCKLQTSALQEMFKKPELYMVLLTNKVCTACEKILVLPLVHNPLQILSTSYLRTTATALGKIKKN